MKRIIFAMVACLFSIVLCAQSDGQKWLAEARKGNVKAMFQAAVRYKYGFDGLPKSEQKAIFWAEKAANKGNSDAMQLLSLCYDDLKNKKYESKRLYWLIKSAQAGNLEGMKHLCSAYSLLTSYVTEQNEKIKCVEQILYWNNKMMEHPEIDSKLRDGCEKSVRLYNYKLEQLKSGAEW